MAMGSSEAGLSYSPELLSYCSSRVKHGSPSRGSIFQGWGCEPSLLVYLALAETFWTPTASCMSTGIGTFYLRCRN